MERVLKKKLDEINELKKLLITREMDNKEIISKIKYVMDDIELLLNDFGYINPRKNEYTLEEVSKYTGANGGKAFVVVFGTVYDVTDSVQWNSGMHFGVKAGTDASDYFKSCHNSQMSLLDNFRIVGVLVQ
ncbi:MAG: cytochrome b5 domain-containing protein [Clostridium sp.]